MKMTKTFAMAFALLAAIGLADPILPTTEWQDISPTSTLEEVGKGAGLASTNDLQEALREFEVDPYYLYDNTAKPSTNVLDAQGNLYKLNLAPGKERGGYWTIDKIEKSQATVTYTAHFDDYENGIYTWKTDGVFRVDYNINTGLAEVQLLFEPLTNGIYSCGAGNDPLENKIPDEGFQYVSGYKVDSLHYYAQGPSAPESQPYDSFVRTSKYNTDMNGVVKSVNNQSGDITGIATEDWVIGKGYLNAEQVNQRDVDLATKTDAYKISASEPTPISIVGRLKTLEQASQELKHDVVYEVWSSDLQQVMDAYGKIYGTHFEPNGAWKRIVGTSVFMLTNGTYDTEAFTYTWHETGNNGLTYCTTNGVVTYGTDIIATIATNLDPAVSTNADAFGTIDATAIGNKFEFIASGYVRNSAMSDQTVFNSQLASKTVTGLNIDGAIDIYGNLVYNHGNIKLPNYTSKIMTQNMDTAWPDYAANSIVGRIKELEGGGANKKFLNRTDMDAELVDDEAKTNNSVVGNLYRVKNDYVKHSDATNIAGNVATNVVDDKVTEEYIRGKNFYNKTEIDDKIDSKIEQKRVDYIYDNVDDPKQVMDSDGKLFWFGIDDLGGSFNATNTTEGNQFLGNYIYKGLAGGTNRWTNAYAKVIWYEPETGKMGDTLNGAYEGAIETGLMPTNCDRIADINTDRLKAEFIPQVTNVNHVYKSSYDRLVKKSETDASLDGAMLFATNNTPTILAASIEATARRFNPMFTSSGQWSLESSSQTQFSLGDEGRAVAIQVDTMHNSIIEIGFSMQLPARNASYASSFTFMKASSTSTVPSLLFTNGTLMAEYPQRINSSMSSFDTDKFYDFKLTIDKTIGLCELTITNRTTGGTQRTFKFPSSPTYNKSKAYGDTLEIGYNDVIGMPSSSHIYLDITTLYVKYESGEKSYLLGTYGDEWQRVYKVFAEREAAPSGAVELRVASPSKYGLVKFDGTTIRINELGQLEADAGGVDLQQVIDVMTQTNAADFASVDSASTVGIVKSTQTKIGQLENQVQELINTISNLNTRIEAALNGQE